jgi:Methyltransferase domain
LRRGEGIVPSGAWLISYFRNRQTRIDRSRGACVSFTDAGIFWPDCFPRSSLTIAAAFVLHFGLNGRFPVWNALARRTLGPVRHDRLRHIKYWITAYNASLNTGRRECPACGVVGNFRAFGYPPRYDAECENCGSLERHRLLCLAFERLGLLSPGQKVLHFAPEPVISRVIGKYDVEHRTADFAEGRGEMRLNIEQIDLPDGSFDVVIANHVLEHVDDRRAFQELCRIIAPGGRLILTVPLVEGWDTTYENPSITTEAERTLHFGQFDHVRFYGRDFRDRIRAASFALEEFVCDGAETVKYGLWRGERIFIATKSAVGNR